MLNRFLFSDEAGCFTFTRGQNVSRYFILCSVTMDECAVGTSLLELRRKLVWQDAELGEYFHATTDKQAVRDAVYETILGHPFHIQATLMEKSKAQAHIKISKPTFYKFGWYYHFKHATKDQFTINHKALGTAASLGVRKERAAFKEAVDDVMRQTMRAKEWRTDFLPCGSDPCLQVADYCAWAIQRKWESGGHDLRSYSLIQDRITYEYDLWAAGTTHYY